MRTNHIDPWSPSPLAVPGTASDYIQPFEGGPCVAYLRVSSDPQRSHLTHSIVRLLYQEGLEIPYLVGDVESSSVFEPRPALSKAARLAKEHDLVLVAESRCRFVRSCFYSIDGTDDVSDYEFRKLREITMNVELRTLVDEKHARSEQTKRGQAASGNFGGRGKKKHKTPKRKPGRPRKKQRQRFIERQDEVLDLFQRGESIAGIHWLTDIPRSTIYDWIRNADYCR